MWTILSMLPKMQSGIDQSDHMIDDGIDQSLSSEQPEVAKEMDEVMAAVKEGGTVHDIVSKFGKACGLPGSFQGALAGIDQSEHMTVLTNHIAGLLLAPDFVTAVRRNILAGGDCCARANYIEIGRAHV